MGCNCHTATKIALMDWTVGQAFTGCVAGTTSCGQTPPVSMLHRLQISSLLPVANTDVTSAAPSPAPTHAEISYSVK